MHRIRSSQPRSPQPPTHPAPGARQASPSPAPSSFGHHLADLTIQPPRASAATASEGPIQGFFDRDSLARAWRGVTNYLRPSNTFGRTGRAISHYGEATDEVAEEVDRSLRVVSPARLLLGKLSPWHSNRPNDVTRGDRDEINQLLQNIDQQGRRGVPATGVKISTGFLSEGKEEAHRETLRDLIQIAQTPSGRELLRSLDAGGRGNRQQRVDIEAQQRAEIDDPNAGRTDPKDEAALARGRGTGSNIFYIPSGLREVSGVARDALNPWIDPRRGDIALYHELVHAWHQQRGGTRDTYNDPQPTLSRGEERHAVDRDVPREEYRTVGLSARYRGDRLNENRYREERRLLGENVPPRTTYLPIEEGAHGEEGENLSSDDEDKRLL